MSDKQAKKVTRMESELWNATVSHRVSMEKLEGLSSAMCRYWKVPDAKVSALPKHLRDRVADCGQGRIRLGTRMGGRTAWTVAHEVAHHICEEKFEIYGDCIEHHGPEWSAVFLITLDAFYIMPLSASVPMFKDNGVKFHTPMVREYQTEGKRANKRLRQSPKRKARTAQRPYVDGVLAKGSFRGDGRGVETLVFVRL